MYVAKRYFFPPMLKIVSPPTASACGYVLRTSARLVHRNRFAVRNQSSSGVSASLCVSANSRRALRLMTRTNTYSQNESKLSTVRCRAAAGFFQRADSGAGAGHAAGGHACGGSALAEHGAGVRPGGGHGEAGELGDRRRSTPTEAEPLHPGAGTPGTGLARRDAEDHLRGNRIVAHGQATELAPVRIHHGDVRGGGAVGYHHMIPADRRLVIAHNHWPQAHFLVQ